MTDINTWLVALGVIPAAAAVIISAYARYVESRTRERENRFRFERELRGELREADYGTGERADRFRFERELRGELREADYSQMPSDRYVMMDLRAELRNQTRLLEALAVRDASVSIPSEQPSMPVFRGEGLGASDVTSAPRAAELLVREISHSLNTPLSQIEIALALLGSSSNLTAADEEAVARATTSVAISKAFIQAFRLVSGGEMAGEDPQLQELGGLVTRAALVLGANVDQVEVDLPSDIGYRPAFILAMLTPLLENAVEASSDGEKIQVWASRSSATTVLHVSNRLEAPLPEGLYGPGRSSKPMHEGLGLAVVQRLVRSIPGAELDHSVADDTVIFNIALPSTSSSEETPA